MLWFQVLEMSTDTYKSRARPGSTIARFPILPVPADVLVPLSMPYIFWALHFEITIRSLLSPVYPTHQCSLDSPKVMLLLLSSTVWGTGEPWDLRLSSKSWHGCGLKTLTFGSLQTGPETCGAAFDSQLYQ